ncbi:MAG TPA: hypothetical protein VMY39_02455, partial [Planctomycetota bacterium]|nr:hypothetical protein [Planctomycetota bacterium]
MTTPTVRGRSRLAGMTRGPCTRKGSGLIVALSVLAMLAIMATTFMTLVNLDVRVTENYVTDQKSEMIARGMLNYFKALLREDQDRTWGRYENRETAAGFYSRTYGDRDVPETRIPGLVGWTWGTPVSNDFWFSNPWTTWGD